MSACSKTIATAIEKIAPLELAESWDNVGLLIGSQNQRVTKVLLTLDVTTEVVDEAIERKAELIVSHHPFPFQAMKNVITDTTAGTLLTKLLKMDISVYAAHTNLDAAVGGVNDTLAELIQLHDVEPLRPAHSPLVKIATYVPAGYADAVWQAMTDAGAGHIGKYSQCGFRVAGTGTYLPGEDADPFIGVPNQLTTTEEIRIETIAPASLSQDIVQALINAHPYEEVAYDLYPLQNESSSGGLGRVGNVACPLTLSEFASRVKSALPVAFVRIVGNPASIVERVAVCGGAGMGLAETARLSGAQVLVTGDIRYHDALDALASGICLVDAGHFGTEFPALTRLQRYLRECSAVGRWDCQFEVSRKQSDIWQFL